MAVQTEPYYVWHVVRGDDAIREVIYKEPEGDPVDLTGFTATLEIQRGTDFEEVAGVITPLTGTIMLVVDHDITATWSSNPTFKLRLTSADDLITTIMLGRFEVTQ